MGCQSPAPPRRKSCEACKVSKRRCDLAFPACSRCLHRHVPCVYPGRQPATSTFDIDIPPPLDLAIEFDQSFAVDPYFLSGIDVPPTPSLTPPVTDAPCAGSNYVDNQSQVPWQEPSQVLPVQPAFEMTNPRARPPKPLSEVVASRLQFSIDILKDAPKSMVIGNQTPWCHPQLYKNSMPRAMQGE